MTARRLSRARAARPPPRPSSEPVTVQRRASNTGVIMIGQNSALGRIHAGQIVTVHVAEHTVTINLGGDGTRAIRRTTTQAVRSIKPTGPQGQSHSCLLVASVSISWESFVNIRSD